MNRGARGDSSQILAGIPVLNEKPPLQAFRLSGGSRSLKGGSVFFGMIGDEEKGAKENFAKKLKKPIDILGEWFYHRVILKERRRDQ